MSSDVVLTTALRNNLLSLKNAQNTGKASESSLSTSDASGSEKPAASGEFLSAQSLSNRASELTRVLDDISQSVRTIENASVGAGKIESLLKNAAEILESVLSDKPNDNPQAAFNATLDQIDTTVEESAFRGVNLLNGDDLVTNFNADGSSSITIKGDVFTTTSLNVGAITDDRDAIPITLAAIGKAIDKVSSFGSSVQEKLSVIQARRSFTEGTISSLNAGAGELNVTDQSEEGASLLALQTRQALSGTRIPLASQAQQSILRNF